MSDEPTFDQNHEVDEEELSAEELEGLAGGMQISSSSASQSLLSSTQAESDTTTDKSSPNPLV